MPTTPSPNTGKKKSPPRPLSLQIPLPYVRKGRLLPNEGEYYSRHPLYRIWCGMRYRCENRNSSSWRYYGYKGIRVCEEWQDFGTFFEWAMVNSWSPSKSIDRIDSNGNYCPSNCRFLPRRLNSAWRGNTRKHVGKIYGTWTIVEKPSFTKKCAVECIHCGRRDFLNQLNVIRKKSRQCSCMKSQSETSRPLLHCRT